MALPSAIDGPRRGTLFPYTTLFRSSGTRGPASPRPRRRRAPPPRRRTRCSTPSGRSIARRAPGSRSEEHTSELQSHVNLVCRLLLEKKKPNVLPDIVLLDHLAEVFE